MKLELHERNKSFSWKKKTPPFSFLSEAEVKQYDEQGFFLLKGAFSKEEIDRVLNEIDPFEEKVTEDLRQHKDGKFLISRADDITFTTHLVLYSNFFKSFGYFNLSNYKTSKSPAAPIPPPTHIVQTTNFAFRRFPSINACPTSLAPDIPNG